MRYFNVPTAVLLFSILAGCQSGRHQALDVETALFTSDRGDDIRELWAVEAGTRRKLEPLLEGASATFTPRFSPTKEWLAVEESLGAAFTMTRLFHQESSGGFRRIPEEEFVLAAFNNFLLGFKLQEPGLAARSVTVEKWNRGGKELVLRFEARTRDGKSFTTAHVVDLARYE